MKYITTPIYYINGNPHIGHAYTTVTGDVMKRMFKMQSHETFYTTGTDENGQKNQQVCEELGLTAQEYKDINSQNFKDLFDSINIDYDYFVRTSNPKHEEIVKNVLSDVYNKGLIIKKSYEGMYCVGCEQFKKETDLTEDGLCPDHLKAPKKITEENYFLKLEPYRQWLIDEIKANPDWIKPEAYQNKLLDMLSEPLDDLCISRPKDRVQWGIELPFDHDFVTYIWFDALLNYISSLNYGENPDFNAQWQNATHLIGKDILKPHCIYWPIMLKAIGVKTPAQIRIHGFLTAEDGHKMSKSLGNVVDPLDIKEKFGTDCLRYYLADNTIGSRDAKISENLINECYVRLANILGNYQMRSCSMLKKYNNLVIPKKALVASDEEFLSKETAKLTEVFTNFNDVEDIPKVTKAIDNLCVALNTFIEKKEPWSLAKDETLKPELDSCMYTLMEGLKLLAIALSPIMLDTSKKILETLNISADNLTVNSFNSLELENSEIGSFELLFPRLD